MIHLNGNSELATWGFAHLDIGGGWVNSLNQITANYLGELQYIDALSHVDFNKLYTKGALSHVDFSKIYPNVDNGNKGDRSVSWYIKVGFRDFNEISHVELDKLDADALGGEVRKQRKRWFLKNLEDISSEEGVKEACGAVAEIYDNATESIMGNIERYLHLSARGVKTIHVGPEEYCPNGRDTTVKLDELAYVAQTHWFSDRGVRRKFKGNYSDKSKEWIGDARNELKDTAVGLAGYIADAKKLPFFGDCSSYQKTSFFGGSEMNLSALKELCMVGTQIENRIFRIAYDDRRRRERT